MKSGIEQLREEKYRFTIETQGLLYTSADRRSSTQDDGTAWSEDDSDRDVPRKKSPPLAQRMATELIRVLREGKRGFLTDDALERLLAGSLQSRSDVAGYDVAKDYIKQVLGQLYGSDNATSSKFAEPGAESKHSAAELPANASTAPNRISSLDSSSGGSLVASGPGPPLSNPMQLELPTAGAGAMAPPWTVTIGRGSAGPGVANAPAARGVNDDEMERPRPRPHHGRIKEQLDLLQNADQLAAIISVATTAATTAAAAAVKQTMQTTTPLPPGAYARMHTTGQPMYNLPTVNAAMGRAAKGALRRQLGAAADVLGDESPDPQPQQRHGALVSPHQRTTPMVLTRRQEAGASVPGVAQGVGISRGEHQEQGEGEPALGPLSGEVRLRRQRLRWSQRRGLSLEPLPAGAADGGRRATSPGEIHSANTTSTGNSNLRVVRLGTPRVTARTPTPGGSERDSIRVQRPGRPALVGAELGSGTQPVTSTGTATVEVAPRQATAEHVLLPDTADMKPVPLDNGITAIQQHQPAEAPLVVESVSPGGFFVTGGESVFTRARMAPELSARNREVDAKKVAAKDLKPASPRSRRAALPEDMQDAFRSTLAFISDPSTARVQQRPVPSWAALDDVEERKQAQREAEELLGGAFDYSAMKRELERAKRTSRLLQQAAGPLTPPASMGQVPIGGPELHAAGSRPRPAGGTRPAISVPANLALQPRGNFEGLLPPPHSVWDVDEAWSDLDQFTKAVEAEVAYRAAAAGPSRRGSPARTQAALRTSTITATTVSEKTVNAVRASDRLPAGRAISTATAAAPATGGGKEQSAATVHTGGRKRTASPGTEIAAQRLMAGAVERSPSPLRIERKTQASGPIRIAFGRRVDEPPKAAEGRTSRIRSGSPPKARVSHGGTRSRTRKVANTEAVVASPISLSAGDAVGQVLSALASALLSDGDEAEDESCVDPGNEMVVSAGGNLPGLMLSLADAVPCRDTHEPEAEAGQTAALAGEVARADGSEHTASSPSQNAVQEDLVDPSLPPQHAHQQQLVGHGSDTLGHPAEPSITRDNSQENSRKEVHSIQAASGVLGAAGSNASISTSLVRQLGTHPWPNTTAASRPRFQYVIDTAHPPITRLPAWAASAKVAEGAPAAYAAALGTAPIGLGLSTQPQQQLPIATSMPFSTTVTQPANVPSQPSSAFEIHASSQDGGDGNIIAATKASYAQFWQHQELQHQEQQQQAAQRLAFSAPLDLPSNTHILPQQAVASALAATDVSVAERGAPDSNQQWEGAVTRAVEDEVVGRLAVMQLAAQREEPMVSPQDVAGMLPPLLDMELSRRLVCDVLRDNLRSLIVDQQQQEHRQGPTIDEGAVGTPTLEEPDGQPSSITDATAASHPTAEISPRDNPLPTTMPAGRPLGLAMGALSSVPPPTVTPVPGVPASVVQNVLSEPHLVTARLEQETAALPSLTVALPGPTGKQSPTMSQGTQARVLQGRGVQAHGAEARGVQAYGVVEARAVQAHGMEARGTQAAGVQERGTQAAGIMDSSSQADPPLPHYLLQASLASGLSYGAGMPLPTIIPTTGLGARQPVLEQGGAALSMPRPFYLVPADGSQLPPTTGLYGPASGLAFPPYTRGEGSRPPFNIPGLSKLRDSSDVDSSTDSMDRHLQAPGARARAAALAALRLASRGSLDSDDGLLQRSYAQLELASLTARPVRLDRHRTSSEDSQLPQQSATGLGQPSCGTTQHQSIDRSDSGERGADASGGREGGLEVQGRAGQASGMGVGSPVVGDGLPNSEACHNERGPTSHAFGGHVERSDTVPPTYLTRRSSLASHGSADEPRCGSSLTSSGGAEKESLPRCSDAANGIPIARSAGGSSSARLSAVKHASSPSQATASRETSLDGSGQPADSAGPRGSGQGPALPSGELSVRPVDQDSVAVAQTPSIHREGASGRQPAIATAEPAVTPAVEDDEFAREDDFANGSDDVHSVHFESSLDQIDGPPEAGERSTEAGTNATDGTSAAPAGKGDASRTTNVGAGSVQQPPIVLTGWKPQGDVDNPAGERCSAAAGETRDFALSDDELLDEAEVTRVLAEEDAWEAAEDELEGADEQDEDLRLLEGQVVVQQESSLEVGFRLSATNESVAADPQEYDSVAVQSGEESPTPDAGVRFWGTGYGNSSERGGDSAVGSRQTSAMQLSEQSRIVSLDSWGGSAGPDSVSVASRIDPSVAERPRLGSVTNVESTTAVSLQRGNKASDRGMVSDAIGRRSMSTGASHGALSPGSSGAGDASELPKSAQDPDHLDIENQPCGGPVSDADAGDALRTSLERLALAGLAPLSRLQAGAGVGSSGLMRVTAAPVPLTSQQPQISGAGAMVAMSQRRSALAPLQATSLQLATSMVDSGVALPAPDSPSKPPSLANYQGPTRQLWRPPSAQQAQDPLWTSSETVMASSEASGPNLDPLTRTYRNAQRRVPTLGTDVGLAAAMARETGDSIESSVDLLTSIDSVPAAAATYPLHTIAGATLPHLLGRTGPAAESHRRDVEFSHPAGSDAESDVEGQVTDGVQQGSTGLYNSKETGAGRGNSRREGAVFRLRQYGARRRKLMQQIGVNDPLLLSSASSLSTDSSTISESNGD